MAPQLRKAAAAARETLIALAAEQWKVDTNSVRIVDARFVNHDASKSLTIAEVAKGQKLVKTIPADVATTPASKWTIAGTSVPKVDGRDFVTGKHQYTSDIKREGMLFGKVVRPSALNASLVSSDTKTADAMPGVTVVRDGDFIGVVAPDQQTAIRAEKSIAVHWKAPGQPGAEELFDYLKKNRRRIVPLVQSARSPMAWLPLIRNFRKRTPSRTSRMHRRNRAPLLLSGTMASSLFGPERRDRLA